MHGIKSDFRNYAWASSNHGYFMVAIFEVGNVRELENLAAVREAHSGPK